MKKYLIYGGMFLGSFLLINVAMYFLLDMTQPEPAAGTQSATDSTEVHEDTLKSAPVQMVEDLPHDSTAETQPTEKAEIAHQPIEEEEPPTPESSEHFTEAKPEPEPVPEEPSTDSGDVVAAANEEEPPAIVPATQTGDAKELAKLAKVLEGMKANDAAAIAGRLTVEEIVSLVMKMKDRKAAKMLAALPVEKAARVAARMSEIVQQGNVQS